MARRRDRRGPKESTSTRTSVAGDALYSLLSLLFYTRAVLRSKKIEIVLTALPMFMFTPSRSSSSLGTKAQGGGREIDKTK